LIEKAHIRLESGLKLDLNCLARRGCIQPGACKVSGISWTNNYTGEQIASGTITADMSGPEGAHGWFRMQIGSLDQRIHLIARPRHFGGRQWVLHLPVHESPRVGAVDACVNSTRR
jgi:hypothetical protein